MGEARARIRVTGTVQGVGFRPFVYRHAVALGLSGCVCNDTDGVLIDVQGDSAVIERLEQMLVDAPPPLARVKRVVSRRIEPARTTGDFRIVETIDDGAPNVPVGVDTATCADCLAEVDDPNDRRYRYAFTNCTNCGPRYTIVRAVPYDRATTTMAGFEMCPACAAEYHDPANRRFHAQPDACPVCGPSLWWWPDELWSAERSESAGTAGGVGGRGDPLPFAVAALARGDVVAVKGVGGYHLAVDATSDAAVARLRRRKHRDDKPFAVLVKDLPMAETLGVVDAEARAALTSPRRPVVLVPRREAAPVAEGVAPGLGELGLLLPYSPLHHLLAGELDRPLVLTSGNLSDEPIAHEDDHAVERLGALVDGILGHDRPIHIRCDDSVARAARNRLQLLRRCAVRP